MDTISTDALSPIQKAWIEEILNATPEQLERIVQLLTE